MIITNKTHQGMSIAAAIVILLTMLFSTASSLLTVIQNFRYAGSAYTVTTLVNLVISIITNILLIIILFRGRKDSIAGAIFVITALIVPCKNAIGNIINIFQYLKVYNTLNNDIVICSVIGLLIYFVANLSGLAFRGLLALECFKPGQICGGKMKALLILLPVANIALNALAYIAQQLSVLSDYGLGEFLLVTIPVAVVMVITSVGTVLMGLAFAIPVYERNPQVIG